MFRDFFSVLLAVVTILIGCEKIGQERHICHDYDYLLQDAFGVLFYFFASTS